MIPLDTLAVGDIVRFVNEHPEHAEQRAFPSTLVQVSTAPYGIVNGSDVWVHPPHLDAADGWFALDRELHRLPVVRVPRRVQTLDIDTTSPEPPIIWRAHWYRDASNPRGGHVGWIPATHRAARALGYVR